MKETEGDIYKLYKKRWKIGLLRIVRGCNGLVENRFEGVVLKIDYLWSDKIRELDGQFINFI